MSNSPAQTRPAHAVDDRTKIAVLIPCFNEEVTIRKVVGDFRRQLPAATIYVYDNNSSDRTGEIAAAEGAVVVREKRQGKGFVMASMFEDVEADVFVLVDGDDTYPADKVHELIRPIVQQKADMAVGTRLIQYADRSFRPLHVFGNALVVRLVNMIFNSRLTDIMSGYRAFNRDFVKKVPLVSKGFEVETQMTLQALYYDFVIAEVPIRYGKRPEGSHSKLRTFSDGARVLLKIIDIFKAYRPLLFFHAVASLLFCMGLLIGGVPVAEFIESGRISHLPSAVLASGIMVIAVICAAIGTILDAINHRLRELMRAVSSAPASRPIADQADCDHVGSTAEAGEHAGVPAPTGVVDVDGILGAWWESTPLQEAPQSEEAETSPSPPAAPPGVVAMPDPIPLDGASVVTS